MNELRFGLIGAGRWGRRYIQTFKEIPGVRLVKVASRNQGTSTLVDELCVVVSDWRDMVADNSIDGIVIATPPEFHAPMAEAAMRAGHHTLIEKPMTLSPAQARSLATTSRATGRMAFVGHTHLFASAFRSLKAKAAELGTLRRVNCVAGNWGPYRADTPVLWDWAPHDIAMCIDLFGTNPLTLDARQVASAQLPEGVGEAIELNLGFGPDAGASIRVSNVDSTKSRRLEARYDAGTLIYDDLAPDKLKFVAAAQTAERVLQVAAAMPLANLLNEFASEIRAESRFHASTDLGICVVDALARAERALNADCRASSVLLARS